MPTHNMYFRRGAGEDWERENPVLGPAEIGIEALGVNPDGSLDFGPDVGGKSMCLWKLGDGKTPWNSLPYSSGPPGPPGKQGPPGDPATLPISDSIDLFVSTTFASSKAVAEVNLKAEAAGTKAAEALELAEGAAAAALKEIKDGVFKANPTPVTAEVLSAVAAAALPNGKYELNTAEAGKVGLDTKAHILHFNSGNLGGDMVQVAFPAFGGAITAVGPLQIRQRTIGNTWTAWEAVVSPTKIKESLESLIGPMGENIGARLTALEGGGSVTTKCYAFLTSGTWTAPEDGMVYGTLVGAGGGGGGRTAAGNTTVTCLAGTAGAVEAFSFSVKAGAVVPVVVGATTGGSSICGGVIAKGGLGEANGSYTGANGFTDVPPLFGLTIPRAGNGSARGNNSATTGAGGLGFGAGGGGGSGYSATAFTVYAYGGAGAPGLCLLNFMPATTTLGGVIR